MKKKVEKPLIVQSDRTILLEVENPLYEEARDALSAFAELVKSPEHFHTYRITPISLWNSASAGYTATRIIDLLHKYSRYDVPSNLIYEINDTVRRYGRLKLYKSPQQELILESDDAMLLSELLYNKALQEFGLTKLDSRRVRVNTQFRGHLKSVLVKLGFPAEDLAGYVEGAPLKFELRKKLSSGKPFILRDYQIDAISAFYAGGTNRGGSGVIVLPCGAGKTIVGIGVMHKLQTHTLVLTTNTVALRQWKAELLEKTTLTEDHIGEYSGELKEIKPVTLATYQILTHRKTKDSPFLHFRLFEDGAWGLIIYDEVHLLPAPVFRATADLQARRRLGLTATLVREDGREDEVFSLIGPKKCDIPWKVLEKQGWIAEALCTEVRIPMMEDERYKYVVASKSAKFQIASKNPIKISICKQILEHHKEDNVLIIGQYLDQLKIIQKNFGAPIITGQTPNKKREELYQKFRNGDIKLLIVSKVANFAIDLPDANVAIQVSGTFGSRQEEAQRLGRILRPKESGKQAHFYTIVTRDTLDQDYALNRQLFLTEQGYQYKIISMEQLNELLNTIK
ncbi:MAG TPA: DEAD/DEAH box helicase [Candidatus Hydrogenedens sp.]|nr:DEAD/DEAH box helicase [Candidatus Hydrogenedens sp.]HOK08450.1 DEAD/DEAH box helicase [Candidatus Hydrogenedens sp.]HOL20285.1 DEAD/DEAH box helicase [Candidatus Hydrogenedens sp.]HPP58137.1 DEAD/DEAH box helicase [Candidatus Hydrogenedens sp.]